ncbi:MAG: winged helix-turn-helix transcriptional regulator [Alphaproteobacteria bacterium]
MAERDAGPLDDEAAITLGLLNAVHENSALTQRSVARELGIALGLANAYLKRCAKKGLIKVSQVPPNRYAYYLTPQGFAEKSRLTAEYLSSSFTFFRRARAQCAEAFETCAERGWSRVALAGTGDLCEIAILCARDFPVTLLGCVERGEGASDARFGGLAVTRDIQSLGAVNAVVVTDLVKPQATFESVVAQFAPERVLTPALLKVVRAPNGDTPEAAR